MDDNELDALAKGMVPFVRECVTEATTPLAVRVVELEARQPERGEKGDSGAAPTIEQITEAISALHVEAIVRDALTAESHKGGIDVLAPQDVAAEMANATAMLAEPFIDRSGAGKQFRPRNFRFERDAENRVVAAFEE